MSQTWTDSALIIFDMFLVDQPWPETGKSTQSWESGNQLKPTQITTNHEIYLPFLLDGGELIGSYMQSWSPSMYCFNITVRHKEVNFYHNENAWALKPLLHCAFLISILAWKNRQTLITRSYIIVIWQTTQKYDVHCKKDGFFSLAIFKAKESCILTVWNEIIFRHLNCYNSANMPHIDKIPGRFAEL